MSLAINRKFQVLINKDNRLSLKKNAYLNSKIRIDVSGTKEKGEASKKISYNLDLSPSDRTLLVIELVFVFELKYKTKRF